VELKAKVRSPLRKRVDVGGERHVLRLGEIDATVGSATVFVQCDDENTTIRESDANVSVVGIGTGDKRPPRETNTPEPLAESS
jgi:hypothetical protein